MEKQLQELKDQPLDMIQEGYFCYDKQIKYNTLSEYAARKTNQKRCSTLSGCMEVHAGTTPYDELIGKIEKGILYNIIGENLCFKDIFLRNGVFTLKVTCLSDADKRR